MTIDPKVKYTCIGGPGSSEMYWMFKLCVVVLVTTCLVCTCGRCTLNLNKDLFRKSFGNLKNHHKQIYGKGYLPDLSFISNNTCYLTYEYHSM